MPRLLTSLLIATLIVSAFLSYLSLPRYRVIRSSSYDRYDFPPTEQQAVSAENDQAWLHDPWSFGPQIRGENAVLRQLALTNEFEYRRICLVAIPSAGIRRSVVQNIAIDVFAEPEVQVVSSLQLEDEQSSASPCRTRTAVRVPSFEHLVRKDAHVLMLGMATTLSRLDESLPAIARWLSGTGAQLLVLVTDIAYESEQVRHEMNQILERSIASDMQLMIEIHTRPEDSEAKKNFALAERLYQHERTDTQWFGIIDDDTFFISLSQLLAALQVYDQNELWYIGSLSEGLSRIAREGFKAWGGAGFFISPPLMQILADYSEECVELDQGFGDLLWRDCIMHKTSPTVQLTRFPGLNQIDLWKDISGWYEAYHNPVYTVHHWKSWHYHPIPLAHLVTDIAGPDSFLQRYSSGNNTVICNGYSVAYYPLGIPDLGRTELTVVEDVDTYEYPDEIEFLHSLGKTREELPLGKTKLQWKLETANIRTDGTISHYYIMRANTHQGVPIDSVIQIDWSRS